MFDLGKNLSVPLKMLSATYFLIYETSKPPIFVPVSNSKKFFYNWKIWFWWKKKLLFAVNDPFYIGDNDYMSSGCNDFYQ